MTNCVYKIILTLVKLLDLLYELFKYFSHHGFHSGVEEIRIRENIIMYTYK